MQVLTQGITTHVLDTSLGQAAAGIPVRLERHYEGDWHPAGIAITDADGRAHPLDPLDEASEADAETQPLQKGDYRLTFEVAAYFKAREVKALYPFVQVTFSVGETRHYHVPLLLNPFGYSTYLGS